MDNPSVVTKEFSITSNIFDPNKNNNNIFIKKLKMRLEKM
jgi:hypothetical protein